MSEDHAAATLRALRGRREHVCQIVARRHAANPAVFVAGESPDAGAEDDDRVQLVVDFDDAATVLDQVGLSLDLTGLLDRDVPVRSRRGLSEALAASHGHLEPL